MTLIDSSYASIVQGVSQQVPYQRRPGQMESQLNMLSDPVYGLRRRPGARYVFGTPLLPEQHADSLGSIAAEVGGVYYHVMVDNKWVRVLNATTGAVALTVAAPTYLANATAGDIMFVSMRGDLWIGNRRQRPALVTPNSDTLKDPAKAGFFFVRTGAFSRNYTLTIKTGTGAWYTWTYVTPSGSTAGDVNLASPAYIATQLAAYINVGTGSHGITATALNAYVHLSCPSATALTVDSSTGDSYISVSNRMTVSTVSGLPAQLPEAAAGIVCAVGANTQTYQYYQWDYTNGTWQECGKYGSYTALTNMPIRLTTSVLGGAPFLETVTFKARLAGDDFTAPYTAVSSDEGITGMFSYQGRLGFMSREVVCLSSSTSPLLLGRSSVVDVIDSDYIEVFGGSLGGANFKSAVPFNKDLLFFADTHQAVMPAGNTVLTPKNAMLVLTGTATCTSTCAPVQSGRWVQIAGPGATGYTTISNLQPSDYTAGQYITTPASEHLPQYFKGVPISMVAAGASGFMAMLTSGGKIYIQQHLWQGSELAQLAWHEWELAGCTPRSLHMYADKLYVVGTAEGENPAGNVTRGTVLLEIDWRRLDTSTVFLDMWYVQNIAAPQLDWQRARAVNCYVDPDYPTEQWVGYVQGGELIVSPAYEPDNYIVGAPYTSEFTPSPPILKDKSERAIAMDQAKLVRTVGQFRNTGEFSIGINGAAPYVVTPEIWAEAVPGKPQITALRGVSIPVHGPAVSSYVSYSTSGTRDMNLVQLEYTLKFSQRRKRI